MTSVFAIRVAETDHEEKLWIKGDYVYGGISAEYETASKQARYATYFNDFTDAAAYRRTKLARYEHTVFEIVEFKEQKR